MGNFKPSKYQQAIYDTFRTTNKNIVVNAIAGSGKTTTAIQLLDFTTGRDVTFVAFNKSIVNELKDRVPRHVKVMTMHSMGMKAIMRKHGKVKVDASKTGKFVKAALNEERWNIEEDDLSLINDKGQVDGRKLGMAKAALYIIIPKMIDAYRVNLCENIRELAAACGGMGIDYKEYHLDYAMSIWEDLVRYNKNPKSIDFTDMIYLPATNTDYFIPPSDIWIVDEAQDLSTCQHLLFKRARRNSRFVAVGDPKQSIYLFAGASSTSFDKFKKYPNTVELPLSLCYRCGVKIAAHANKVYDIVESPEWMDMGEVYFGDYMEAEASSEDMIICRNTNPLISAFFKLIAKRKKAYIKGKDIGENLIRMIKPYENQTVNDLMSGLTEDASKLEGELIQNGISAPRRHPRWINFMEKVVAIEIISEQYSNIKRMIQELEHMFSDSGTGICLSTGHKSKGLEADNVYFLDSHLIPSKFSVTQEQILQEENLKYVMITRAKKKLVYCYSHDD